MEETVTFQDVIDTIGEAKLLLNYQTSGSIEAAQRTLDTLSKNVESLSSTLKADLNDMKYIIETMGDT